MITEQQYLLHLGIDEFLKKIVPTEKDQTEILYPEKKIFMISRFENLTSKLDDFQYSFIPEFYSIYFLEHGRFEKINQLEVMVLEGGEVYFSKPGEVINWRFAEDAKGFFIAFTKEYLLTLIDNKNFLNSFDYLTATVREKFELELAQYEFFADVFEEMMTEYSAPKKHSQISIQLWLSVLLIKINRMYKGGENVDDLTSFKRSSDFIYHKFVMALEDNFYDLSKGECIKPYTVSEFAKKLNVNPSYLNECVKKRSGKNVKSFINERWLLLAKCQIMHTTKNISEIAYNLGFESPGYFARFFKKFEGISPIEFRQSIGFT